MQESSKRSSFSRMIRDPPARGLNAERLKPDAGGLDFLSPRNVPALDDACHGARYRKVR
jgi:hypothetical protein